MTAPFFARPSPNHQTPNNECDSDGCPCGHNVERLTSRDAGQCDGGEGYDIYESLEALKGKGDYPENPVSNQIPAYPYASKSRGELPQTVSCLETIVHIAGSSLFGFPLTVGKSSFTHVSERWSPDNTFITSLVVPSTIDFSFRHHLPLSPFFHQHPQPLFVLHNLLVHTIFSFLYQRWIADHFSISSPCFPSQSTYISPITPQDHASRISSPCSRQARSQCSSHFDCSSSLWPLPRWSERCP